MTDAEPTWIRPLPPGLSYGEQDGYDNVNELRGDDGWEIVSIWKEHEPSYYARRIWRFSSPEIIFEFTGRPRIVGGTHGSVWAGWDIDGVGLTNNGQARIDRSQFDKLLAACQLLKQVMVYWGTKRESAVPQEVSIHDEYWKISL